MGEYQVCPCDIDPQFLRYYFYMHVLIQGYILLICPFYESHWLIITYVCASMRVYVCACVCTSISFSSCYLLHCDVFLSKRCIRDWASKKISLNIIIMYMYLSYMCYTAILAPTAETHRGQNHSPAHICNLQMSSFRCCLRCEVNYVLGTRIKSCLLRSRPAMLKASKQFKVILSKLDAADG